MIDIEHISEFVKYLNEQIAEGIIKRFESNSGRKLSEAAKIPYRDTKKYLILAKDVSEDGQGFTINSPKINNVDHALDVIGALQSLGLINYPADKDVRKLAQAGYTRSEKYEDENIILSKLPMKTQFKVKAKNAQIDASIYDRVKQAKTPGAVTAKPAVNINELNEKVDASAQNLMTTLKTSLKEYWDFPDFKVFATGSGESREIYIKIPDDPAKAVGKRVVSFQKNILTQLLPMNEIDRQTVPVDTIQMSFKIKPLQVEGKLPTFFMGEIKVPETHENDNVMLHDPEEIVASIRRRLNSEFGGKQNVTMDAPNSRMGGEGSKKYDITIALNGAHTKDAIERRCKQMISSYNISLYEANEVTFGSGKKCKIKFLLDPTKEPGFQLAEAAIRPATGAPVIIPITPKEVPVAVAAAAEIVKPPEAPALSIKSTTTPDIAIIKPQPAYPFSAKECAEHIKSYLEKEGGKIRKSVPDISRGIGIRFHPEQRKNNAINFSGVFDFLPDKPPALTKDAWEKYKILNNQELESRVAFMRGEISKDDVYKKIKDIFIQRNKLVEEDRGNRGRTDGTVDSQACFEKVRIFLDGLAADLGLVKKEEDGNRAIFEEKDKNKTGKFGRANSIQIGFDAPDIIEIHKALCKKNLMGLAESLGAEGQAFLDRLAQKVPDKSPAQQIKNFLRYFFEKKNMYSQTISINATPYNDDITSLSTHVHYGKRSQNEAVEEIKTLGKDIYGKAPDIFSSTKGSIKTTPEKGDRKTISYVIAKPSELDVMTENGMEYRKKLVIKAIGDSDNKTIGNRIWFTIEGNENEIAANLKNAYPALFEEAQKAKFKLTNQDKFKGKVL